MNPDIDEELRKMAIPLSALEDPSTRANAKKADVIFGLDVSRDVTVLFWGAAYVRKIVNRRIPANAAIMVFLYDQRTESLEWLIGAVTSLKRGMLLLLTRKWLKLLLSTSVFI